MKESFFKDIKIQDEFNANGFVKLKMFSEEEVIAFKEFYNSLNLKDEKKYGFIVSIDEDLSCVRSK